MEELDPHVEAAVLWLAQTILEVLFAGKMEDWIRQVGLADDTERLKSEIERVEAVVAAVKGRAAENRPLGRSLGRLKELLYDADDMVDELDYYRLQHQVEGGTIAWANQTQGTDVIGGAQLVDGSRDNSVIPNRNNRKKPSKAWEEFIIGKGADGKPLKAKCKYCHTVVRCETTNGTSVLHNHLKSDNCKRKRAAIEPNPSSAADGAQNGATAADCSDSRKRMRIDEESAHNTAASTHPWDKAEFCNRIQQTIHQLQKATSEVQKLYVSGSVASLNLCRNTAADPCRKTSSLVQRKMYGRVAEKNSILQLMAEGTSDGVLILPIVGIGGIGKTALAQLVYNDPIVKKKFDHRMWVWVSSNFDEVRLTLEMLYFVSQEKCIGIGSLAKLQEILVTHVTSQRILLILDDVWDDIDDCRWNKLLAPLRSENAKGNVILVTTRKLSIAKRIGTVEPIQLGNLRTDDFWLLFKTCSFGDENYNEHLSLSTIGRQIAEKLQGNPLAAETAGMLLREYLTIDHWSSILKSEKWKSLDLDGGIMHALKLSYDELPYYLQQCFLYCSIFPPSHQFVSKELICIWISHGFVNCGHSTVRLEEIGRNHLTNLVNSGFFEQVETQDTTPGDQTCYVISGLMHDFARQVSRTFCATINSVECTKVQPSVRHLSIVTDAAYHKDHRGNILLNVKFEEKMRSITTHIVKLRTLVLIGEFDSLIFGLFNHIFQKARRLRLLQISSRNADYASLSCDSISPTHLRYLKLVDNDGDGALSHSLSKFYHLQVLHIGHCRGLKSLDLCSCTALEGLTIRSCSSLAALEGNFTCLKKLELERNSRLESLQLRSCTALEELDVRYCESLAALEGNFTCLKKLHMTDSPSLKSLDLRSCTALEELMVDNCESLAALEGNFACLRKLQLGRNPSLKSLQLRSCTALEDLEIKHCDSLETLQPCFLEDRNCLKKLLIGHCRGLKSLDLCSCTALEGLTIITCSSLAALEGNFTCLKKLELRGNSRLESLDLRFCTALEDLEIKRCESLAALEGNFTCLKKLVLFDNPRLEIKDCESLDVLEDFQSLRGLRYLNVYRCSALTPYLESLLSQGYELCAGLESLGTDDYSFLTTSFCKCLTSLQRLEFHMCTGEATRLTDEQEIALHLLMPLRELRFVHCYNLVDLPVGLHGLPSLRKLVIIFSPRISGLPEKGLPPSLEELDIRYCGDHHKKLIKQCRALATGKLKVMIDGKYVN